MRLLRSLDLRDAFHTDPPPPPHPLAVGGVEQDHEAPRLKRRV